jgi:hypothetical protein
MQSLDLVSNLLLNLSLDLVLLSNFLIFIAKFQVRKLLIVCS